MIKNKYQIYKISGNYTEEEIKSIEGRTFCWNARQVHSEQDKPIDPESSAIPAIFQGIEEVVKNFIMYYNNERLQEKIQELAPMQFRKQALASLSF